MQIMITGVAGFLGSHLALYHLNRGDEVIGIDDFSSSDSNSNHLKRLKEFKTFSLHIKDICEVNFEYFYLPKSNLIYNFACPASPPIYQAMPVKTMMTCVAGTANVLQHARENGSIVVHASTSEVYGDPQLSPQSETYRGYVNSYGPRACYDEGKRAAEALCFDYMHHYDVDVRLVRIFNTYGPNMDPYDGRVVSNFICQALRGEPLTVYGDGRQTRSFCYVDDLIRGIVALGTKEWNPKTPINLGNPNEFTVQELALRVQKMLGGTIVNKPLPVDDPTQRRPDISLASKLLGWSPQVQLDEGLAHTIEYFKKALG